MNSKNDINMKNKIILYPKQEYDLYPEFKALQKTTENILYTCITYRFKGPGRDCLGLCLGEVFLPGKCIHFMPVCTIITMKYFHYQIHFFLSENIYVHA